MSLIQPFSTIACVSKDLFHADWFHIITQGRKNEENACKIYRFWSWCFHRLLSWVPLIEIPRHQLFHTDSRWFDSIETCPDKDLQALSSRYPGPVYGSSLLLTHVLFFLVNSKCHLPRLQKATALAPSRPLVVGIVVGIMVGPARHRSRSGEAGGMSCH